MRLNQLTRPLSEALNTKTKWTWVLKQPGMWLAEFRVGDHDYNVNFAGEKYISITFAVLDGERGWTQRITGTGGANTVLSTVIDIIRAYVGERNPESFVIGSLKKFPSRIRLYDAIVRRLAPSVTGYSVEMDDDCVKEIVWRFSKSKLNEAAESRSATMLAELKAKADRIDQWDSSKLLFKIGQVPGEGPPLDALVSVIAVPFDDSQVSIKEIKVPSTNRNEGSGSKIMKLICDLADKHKITLHLHAKPIKTMWDRNVLSQDKLEAWYAGFGFRPAKEQASEGRYMTRKSR